MEENVDSSNTHNHDMEEASLQVDAHPPVALQCMRKSSFFLETLQSHSVNISQHVPVWLMRQAGRYQPSYQALRKKYSFEEMCLTAELACQVTLLPMQEMPLDAAIIFSDILYALRAYNLIVSFGAQSVPKVATLAYSEDTLYNRAKTVLATPFLKERLYQACSSTYDAIKLVCTQIKKPVIGFSGAPWTLITYILEGKTSPGATLSKAFMYQEPSMAEKLFSAVEQLVVEHLNEQIAAGCTAIQIFDSWSSELSEEEFLNFSVYPVQRIIQKIRLRVDNTVCPVIYYAKGVGCRNLASLSLMNASCLSCDTASSMVNFKEYFEKLDRPIALQGNLDPALLCVSRDSPLLQKRLDHLLKSMSYYDKYIFNLGHGVPKEANYDTVRFVVDTVAAWNKESKRKQ